MITRHCRNCGCEFTPAHSGDYFCGESKECDDAARGAEIERLRSALSQISQDEFRDDWAEGDEFENDYWRVIGIARYALEPNRDLPNIPDCVEDVPR